MVVHPPSSRDATTQEFSRFGLIKFLSLVTRLGNTKMSQIRVVNLNFITTQIGKTLVSSRPGWTVDVQPPDNHLTMSIEYAHVVVQSGTKPRDFLCLVVVHKSGSNHHEQGERCTRRRLPRRLPGRSSSRSSRQRLLHDDNRRRRTQLKAHRRSGTRTQQICTQAKPARHFFFFLLFVWRD